MGHYSFVLKRDSKVIFSRLTDSEAGQLIKAIFDYETDGTEPAFVGELGMGFTVIKEYLDANAKRYEVQCERNRENGKKGGRPLKNPP